MVRMQKNHLPKHDGVGYKSEKLTVTAEVTHGVYTAW